MLSTPVPYCESSTLTVPSSFYMCTSALSLPLHFFPLALQRYPPREMATGVFIMTEYKPELITKVLDLLTPQNLRYIRTYIHTYVRTYVHGYRITSLQHHTSSTTFISISASAKHVHICRIKFAQQMSHPCKILPLLN